MRSCRLGGMPWLVPTSIRKSISKFEVTILHDWSLELKHLGLLRSLVWHGRTAETDDGRLAPAAGSHHTWFGRLSQWGSHSQSYSLLCYDCLIYDNDSDVAHREILTSQTGKIPSTEQTTNVFALSRRYMIPTISSMRQQLLVVMISRLIAEGHCARSRV